VPDESNMVESFRRVTADQKIRNDDMRTKAMAASTATVGQRSVADHGKKSRRTRSEQIATRASTACKCRAKREEFAKPLNFQGNPTVLGKMSQ